MLWFIICFGAAWVIGRTLNTIYKPNERGLTYASFLLVAFFTALLLAMLTKTPVKWVCIGYDEIYSLRDQSGGSGSFVLGTGVFNNRIVYHYYIRSGEGFMGRSLTNHNNVELMECDSKPILEFYVTVPKYSYHWLWHFDYRPSRYYKFKVPKNTVYPGYSVGK